MAAGAFAFMLCWNEFIIAQVLNTKPGTMTLPPVIVAMNGRSIDGRSLRNAVGSMEPGTSINLKVLRNGSEKTVTVTLDRMTEETRRG